MSGFLNISVRKINSWHSVIKHCRQYGKLAITDDGSTIVALHLEQKFPYEHSQPIPEASNKDNESVLQLNDITEIRRVFKDVSPEVAREELMRLTNTTMHRWFSRSRDKKAKKTEMYRPYL